MGHADGFDGCYAEVAVSSCAGLRTAGADGWCEASAQGVAAVCVARKDAKRRSVVELAIERANAVGNLPSGLVDVAASCRTCIEADALWEVPLGEVAVPDRERACKIARRGEFFRVGIERVDPAVSRIRVTRSLKAPSCRA
ncbi:MAG: hypothetical protein JRE19_17200 [Deltaproteobacteria bacterium]|nr:hypothetical protein [Deltaproteobacteria bacterium]